MSKVFAADGLRFDLEVAMEDPDIPALTGAAVEVFASLGGAEVEGVAEVTGPTRVRCTFAPGALAAGRWLVQVRATLAPLPPQTLREFAQQIEASLGVD